MDACNHTHLQRQLDKNRHTIALTHTKIDIQTYLGTLRFTKSYRHQPTDTYSKNSDIQI